MQWFRMYAEFVSDPLVRMLSFEDQRHFVAALCLKAGGALDKNYPSPEIRRAVLAQLIGLNADEAEGRNALDAANARLRKLGLVDENWQPTHWDKRQFQSDHSDPTAAERMRRYRNKRNVTPVTGVVTALDTDTDTDTESEAEKRSSLRSGKPGRKSNLVPDDFALTAEIRAWSVAENPELDPETEFAKFHDHEFREPHSDWLRAWRRWVREGKKRGDFMRKPDPGVQMFEGKPVRWA